MKESPMSTRGIRNNNPGNIRHNKANKWQGASKNQPDNEFVRFDTMVWGVRAMARLLINYYDDYKCDTVTKIVKRWAPEKGHANGKSYTQNTNGYIQHVCALSGLSANEKLNLHSFDHLAPLVRAMMYHETAGESATAVTKDQLTKALVLAGVEPKKKPVAQQSTVKAANVAGTAAVGSAVVPAIIHETTTQLQPYADLSDYIRWALLGLTLAAVVYIVYHQYRKSKQGL